MKRWFVLFLIIGMPSAAQAGHVSTFEDLGLPANSFNNNAGPSGQFVSGGNSFNNTYSPDFGGFWFGWAGTNMTDTTTPGAANMYSAITGAGADGSKTYAVGSTFCGANVDPFHPDASIVNLAAGTRPLSVQVTNTTFADLSMRQGDAYAHKFAAGDYLLLTVTGYNSLDGTGGKVGEVDFYLANFLGSSQEIVEDWRTLDLSSLDGAKSLRFGMKSSDNDPVFGMNTPATFAADNLQVASPEPSTMVLLGAGVTGLGLFRLRKKRAVVTRP